MIETSIYRDGCDFFVSINLAGEQVDTAGPFDDQLDAELAAQRIAPAESTLDPEWLTPATAGGQMSWAGGRYMSQRDIRLARKRVALGAA